MSIPQMGKEAREWRSKYLEEKEYSKNLETKLHISHANAADHLTDWREMRGEFEIMRWERNALKGEVQALKAEIKELKKNGQ